MKLSEAIAKRTYRGRQTYNKTVYLLYNKAHGAWYKQRGHLWDFVDDPTGADHFSSFDLVINLAATVIHAPARQLVVQRTTLTLKVEDELPVPKRSYD